MLKRKMLSFFLNILCILFGYCSFTEQEIFIQTAQKDVVLTVFIHGTHVMGVTSIGLSPFMSKEAYSDLYQKWQKKDRTKHWSYRDGIHGHEGLYTINDSNEHAFLSPMTVPLVRAYDVIRQHVNNGQDIFSQDDIFCWSGMLTHNGRCKAAIDAYRAIGQRVKDLKKAGCRVHVRLVGHSHGGNVALLMAAVAAQLNKQQVQGKHQQRLMGDIARLLAHENDISIFDSALFIDELILLGTPILRETEWLCHTQFFGEVWNLYSDNDIVQGADFISTKGPASGRRFNQLGAISADEKSQTIVRQMKIMVDRKISPNSKHLNSSFSSRNLTRGGKLRSRFWTDPTHSDLWIVDWKNKRNSLGKIPVVVLLESLLQAGRLSNHHDCDVNLTIQENQLVCEVYAHDNHHKLTTSLKVPAGIMEQVILHVN